MEALKVLEEKLTVLIEKQKRDGDVIKALQEENSKLKDECSQLKSSNAELKQQVEKMESSLLAKPSDAEFNEERTKTKVAVDELIKSIDSLITDETYNEE